jgi:hypothetical protein
MISSSVTKKRKPGGADLPATVPFGCAYRGDRRGRAATGMHMPMDMYIIIRRIPKAAPIAELLSISNLYIKG